MSNKKPVKKPEPAPKKCPKCGSTSLSGLMASFWVEIDEEGNRKFDFSQYESATDFTGDLMCNVCDHEF